MAYVRYTRSAFSLGQTFVLSVPLNLFLILRVAYLAAALFDVNVASRLPEFDFSSPTLHVHFFSYGFLFFTAVAQLRHFIFLHRIPGNQGRSEGYICFNHI